MASKLDLKSTYRHWLTLSRVKFLGQKRAFEHAVGGEFLLYGVLELELLKMYGLTEHGYVVDVGCGSGRLAQPLSAYSKGRYLGTDIVPGMIEYARKAVNRQDWRFEVADEFVIPEKDEKADFVCFFSVFTHLLHEQSFVYLRESKRVLKPGGKVVFSFLEFSMASHWMVFEAAVKDIGGVRPLDVFLSRDAIHAWADHLQLQIEAVHDGDSLFIPVPHPITKESGEVVTGKAAFGQSVCVLRKPAKP